VRSESRLFIAPSGDMYRVYRAPLERPGGISRLQRALVFETEDGEWVGAVPVAAEVPLDGLGVDDLLLLLGWAERTG
jgi:hypothetical protein